MSDTPESMVAALRAVFSLPSDDIIVTPDPYGGLRVKVVSESFGGQALGERRQRVLAAIPDESIAALHLTSPDEVQEAPSVLSPADPPLWPEALAGGQQVDTIQVRLASQAHEPLPAPVVATFYSLRGGVGRSTALAHTAYVLAGQGMSVLCIDMDLEAPGLDTLFGVEREVRGDRGVVRLLTEIEILQGPPQGLEDHLIRVSEDMALSLLPAGRPSAAYARDLALLDPVAWYHEEVNPLRVLMESIRGLDDGLRPDVVLIDSRTGISPIAAPLLFDVADIAIVTFFPHPQAKEGTGLLTRALLAARTERHGRDLLSLTPEPRFVVSPVPASPESYARAAGRAQEWVAEWLGPARDESGGRPFDVIEDLIHVVGYTEAVATSDRVTPAGTLAAYEPIAGWIAGMVDPGDPPPLDDISGADLPSKPDVLRTLSFDGRTADEQPADLLRTSFVGTAAVQEALHPRRLVVIGRKGTGKTLVFRQLLGQEDGAAIAVTSPPGIAETRRSWEVTSAFYSAVDLHLERTGSRWEDAWAAIIGLTLVQLAGASSPGAVVNADDASTPYTTSGLLDDVRGLLSVPDSGIVLQEWLAAIDSDRDRPLGLLFDGLDTGFGADRDLRDRAVAGLMLLLNGSGRSLQMLRPKVFIREDIFRTLNIPNKSHLRSAAALLTWNDKTDYLKIVIQRAWRSEEFREYSRVRISDHLRAGGGREFDLAGTSIEFWPDEIVDVVWKVLVGERVAGGKTAFTDNWVWARLADANGDHSPRHLVQLFKEATDRERDLEAGAPFGRAIVRPKALVDALDSVSEEALEAVREEFSELQPVLDQLGRIGGTPFESDKLIGSTARVPLELVDLAAEVGVIEVGDDDRYRVPELYRKALNMTRKGQR